MKVNWDDDIPNSHGKLKNGNQTTNQQTCSPCHPIICTLKPPFLAEFQAISDVREVLLQRIKTLREFKTDMIWLAVSTPLKKYESQLGWLFSRYGKVKKKMMFQTTTNQWSNQSNLQHLAATATAQSCKSTPLPGDLALKNNSVWGVSRRYKFDILWRVTLVKYTHTYIYIYT